MLIQNCRIVLVRPQVAGNLGATARVMRNMGLSTLVLVAPVADLHDRQARQLSTHGESILDKARIVSELGEAVADCVLVAGTTARIGKLIRGQFAPPDEVMPRLLEASSTAPVAIVFGPEPNGLTDEEVTRCHHLIHIPADPDYPALNLAQAVAICTYELRRAWLKGNETSTRPAAASFAEQEKMFDTLRTALEEIHFLYGPKAESLMHALRHLIGRAEPTEMEVGVLFGLVRQMRWFVDQNRH
ncbi:MAG TPA: RNA methyltransferase [Gemmataceae bacterium]|jgi:tRNA/rRNA methyltransferase|nr:RNA methyltransferase [Gemmataceae bacterium]